MILCVNRRTRVCMRMVVIRVAVRMLECRNCCGDLMLMCRTARQSDCCRKPLDGQGKHEQPKQQCLEVTRHLASVARWSVCRMLVYSDVKFWLTSTFRDMNQQYGFPQWEGQAVRATCLVEIDRVTSTSTELSSWQTIACEQGGEIIDRSSIRISQLTGTDHAHSTREHHR